MKTASDKNLFLGLLLILIVATGCSRQVDQSVANSGSVATTDETPDKQKLEDNQPSEEQPSEEQPSEEQPSEEQPSDNQPSEEQPKPTDIAPEESATDNPEWAEAPKKQDDTPAEPTIDIPATWTRLSKTQEIWVDLKNKQVIIGGKVCLNAGPLEMLICPQHTKEHESVVSVNAESWQVDAALLAAGAEKGVPCRWAPEYTQAWGSKIDLKMIWRDEKTKEVKTIDGKQWILNGDTGKPMTTELVFGGSYSAPQLEGDQPRYLANDGELICLANFSTSTIDLSVSEENVEMYFEANTPLIPPLNTQVYTVITPGPVINKPEE